MTASSPRPATRWLIAAVLAAVLAIAAGVWGMTHRYETPTPPGVAQSAATTESPETAGPQGPSSAPPSVPSSGSPAIGVRPGSRPVSVSIPAIDVQLPLIELGLQSDGTLAVPSGAQVGKGAWFTGSPTPGAPGPAVVEAHVTTTTGRGPFFRLASLTAGDRASVRLADGSSVLFTVYRVARYPKNAFPTGDVYGNTTGPELRLITCGGQFDRSTGHFDDNTVVYARVTTPS
ncbi:class F sortase [Branchiibius sp. NY16-3462-2]|uniref:class F sortase n=1 Tax=Branchiibius sp. NY16-3462-2 TaxID=1807500 RepID=UPI000798F664|nr:class F sortase [Branchiibius sp. NY16-3462-2]KYH45653.1 hypothetical protein AZH51_18230 [Branchiibius sp. NY16-3462-2]